MEGLPDILKNKFLYLTPGTKSTYTIPELPAPVITSESPFYKLSPDFTQIPQILKEIYDLHVSTRQPLYLPTVSNANFVSLKRKLEPYFHKIIPEALLDVTGRYSKLNMETILQVFSPEQFYLTLHFLYHFQSLVKCTKIYNDRKTIKKLWEEMLELLLPEKLLMNNKFPLIVSMKNQKGMNVIVNIRSKDKIYIYSRPNSSYERYRFSSRCEIQDKKITLQNTMNEIVPFQCKKINMVQDFFSNEIKSENNTLNYVVSSFLEINPSSEISFSIVESYARMLLNLDDNFIFAILCTIYNYPEAKHLAFALNKIYTYYGQRLRLFKIFGYFEIQTVSTQVNAIYRQNNVFTQIIVDFLRTQSQNFVNLCLAPIFMEVAKQDLLEFDHPKDKDATTADTLFTIFFERITASIHLIPLNVRQLLRCLRIMCETQYGDIQLNHRAVVGLLFLRFLIPIMSSAELLGIKERLPKDAERKNVQFSKALMALSTLELLYDEKSVLMTVFKKHSNSVIKFLDLLTTIKDEYPEGCNATLEEMIQGIQDFRSFIHEGSSEVLKLEKKERIPNKSLAEAINTLYEISIFDK